MKKIDIELTNQELDLLTFEIEQLVKQKDNGHAFELNCNLADLRPEAKKYAEKVDMLQKSFKGEKVAIYKGQEFLRYKKEGEELKPDEKSVELIDQSRIEEYQEALQKLRNEKVKVSIYPLNSKKIQKIMQEDKLQGIDISFLIEKKVIR